MAVREILTVPNEVLYKKSTKVKQGENIEELVKDLIETLNFHVNPKGAGLAAPQIGILKRVCVVKKFSEDPKDPEKELEADFVLINPEIMSLSKETELGWEGCLSIPDTYGQVARPYKVKIKTLDLKGNTLTINADDFFARVIQHEIDHLNGVLFTTKLVGKSYTEKELDDLEKQNHNL